MSWTYFGDLFIFMMERVGLIVLLAVLLVQTPYFKNLLSQQNNRRKIIPLVIVFGLFAILSNLTGIKITPITLKLQVCSLTLNRQHLLRIRVH